jgi:hypothetical protein
MIMKIITLFLAVFVFVFCGTVSAQDKKESSEKKTLADYFLIEKNKPSVYIKFEKSGTASPLYEGEGRERYWLRLFNNTRGNVSFCFHKVAKEYGDIGIYYDVEEILSKNGEGYPEIEEPTVKTKKETESKSEKTEPQKVNPEDVKIPHGYSYGDVCVVYNLESGKSVLFSIPKEHLIVGKRTFTIFTIKTEFKYEWEDAGTEIAGHPLHIVSFSFGDLPFSERKGL